MHGAAAQNKRGIVIIKYGNAALFPPQAPEQERVSTRLSGKPVHVINVAPFEVLG